MFGIDDAVLGGLLAGGGALAGGFLQGQENNSGLEDADQQLLRNSWGENLGGLQLANQWKRYVQPYAQGITSSLYDILQNQLAGRGLPAGLENSIWQLARQRIGNNYNTLGNQLGEQAAGRGTLVAVRQGIIG